MIRTISLVAAAVALLIIGSMNAETAVAGGYHNKHHHGHYDGHAGHHYYRIPFVHALGRVVGALLPHPRRYYRDRRAYYGGDPYYTPPRGYSNHAAPRAYPHHPTPRHHQYSRQQYSRHGSGCHPVNKTEYHHGRLARIGGTMCYDAYGSPYVVSGSRYVMHYYD